MAKGQELWDDSALVDAFDRAVASFKEAHFQGGGSGSAEDVGKSTHGAEDKDEPTNSNISDEQVQATIYQDDNIARKEEIQDKETIQDSNVNSYDELLKQYYELEEKKQTILQQLYTHPNYYNQTLQPDACNDAPQHAAENPQYVDPACSSFNLPVSVVPMTGGNGCGPCNPCFSMCQICDKCPCKYAGCTVAVPCPMDLTKHSCDGDASICLKQGITVADSVMRTANSNTSGKEGETIGISECLQRIGISDADLVPVLNAWYSAGFHTARYLSEKSRENNLQ